MSFNRHLLCLFAALVTSGSALAENSEALPLNNPQNQQNPMVSPEVSANQTNKINLNKATAKELMKVKGLNAPRARAVVAYRKKNGNFESTDDLLKVKGFKKIKPALLKQIQDELTTD